MIPAAPLLTASVLLIAATSTPAQTRPDFSGRWTSEPETAAVPARAGGGRGGRVGDMGSGWGPTLTVTQDAKSLTVEYMFFGRGDLQPPLKFSYALDGSETTNSVMMGYGIQQQRARAAWNDGKLVITTTHTFQNPDTRQPMTSEVIQVLSLESPTSLVVEVTRSGVLGGVSSSTRTVYRKI